MKTRIRHDPESVKKIQKWQKRLIKLLSNPQDLDTEKVLAYIDQIPELCLDSNLHAGISILEQIVKTKNDEIILAALKKFPEGEQLYLAAACGLSHALSLLLAKGLNPNCHTISGASPMYLAAAFGHENCVRVLLRAGANVNSKTKIYSLIRTNQADELKSRLDDGFDPSILTPLGAATAARHYKIMKLLLKHQADPLQLSPYGYALSKLSYACTSILDGDEVSRNLHPYSAIHVAAMNNDIRALQILKQFVDDMNFAVTFTPRKNHHFGSWGNEHRASTPLHAAVASGSLEAASFLLQPSTRLNEFACDKLPYLRSDGSYSDSHIGLTPIHCAARIGHAHLIKLLIMAGAPINSEGRQPLPTMNMYGMQEWTALDFAVNYGQNLETVNLLSESGAQLNYWGQHLQMAIEKNNYRLVERLLKIKSGEKPQLNRYLSTVVANNYLEIAELLIKSGAEVTEPLIKCAESNNYSAMVQLLNANQPLSLHFSKKVKRFFCCTSSVDSEKKQSQQDNRDPGSEGSGVRA